MPVRGCVFLCCELGKWAATASRCFEHFHSANLFEGVMKPLRVLACELDRRELFISPQFASCAIASMKHDKRCQCRDTPVSTQVFFFFVRNIASITLCWRELG